MNVFVVTEVVDVETNFPVGVYATLSVAKSAAALLANGPLRWGYEGEDGANGYATIAGDSNWEIESFEVQ